MRRFKFVGTEVDAKEYDEDNPIVGQIYQEDERVGGCPITYWATKNPAHIREEWEEVFEKEKPDSSADILEGKLQASPDLFEAYLEGIYDAYGGDVEGADSDLTNHILGVILKKYRGLKGK